MKTNNFLRKAASMMAAALLGFAFSCQEDEAPYQTESAYVAEESVTDSYYDDADDMGLVAVASESGTAGGKLSSEASGLLEVNDDRFCALVAIAFDETSTLAFPIGTLTIDFGAGCDDPHGNRRSGKIFIRFSGRRFLPGSVIVITFENYYINGIKLSGKRTLTNISAVLKSHLSFK